MSDNKIKGPLDKVVDFLHMTEQKISFSVNFDSAFMPRLQEVCARVGTINLDIAFYRDMQGLHTLEGDISTNVSLICQRCFEPFDTVLRTHFKSTSDFELASSLRIEDKLDFIELDDEGRLNLLEYLEDCLLLAMPISAMHDEDDDKCKLTGSSWSYGKEEVKEDNPFAALASLKGTLKN
ncbi:Uncharacterized ACR, COG1399 [Anaerobiospirillum thomasii]|uniref:Large ribosomal RNA subunit accumulation protein YceD n=1 Tax=Anaerobiospirillum thomasii TaxID=179995 RepID=A0A2X0VAP8_9GAMM|nr:YceD family protein [Anaerobiospirillum thomasii]SPT67728.1 Uncharacterized ACR, COG1399 [Anaerobiospirillum thomasii]SPT70186.1 Uncharacterized ACR, COG1399 [Anaerobiospirillum thomasii]